MYCGQQNTKLYEIFDHTCCTQNDCLSQTFYMYKVIKINVKQIQLFNQKKKISNVTLYKGSQIVGRYPKLVCGTMYTRSLEKFE